MWRIEAAAREERSFESRPQTLYLATAVKVSSQGPGEIRCRILVTASILSPEYRHTLRPPPRISKRKLRSDARIHCSVPFWDGHNGKTIMAGGSAKHTQNRGIALNLGCPIPSASLRTSLARFWLGRGSYCNKLWVQ